MAWRALVRIHPAVMRPPLWNAPAARQEYDLGDGFRCPEWRIRDIVPVLTMIGGDVTFTRDGERGVGALRG